jgi:hypothetical protein
MSLFNENNYNIEILLESQKKKKKKKKKRLKIYWFVLEVISAK